VKSRRKHRPKSLEIRDRIYEKGYQVVRLGIYKNKKRLFGRRKTHSPMPSRSPTNPPPILNSVRHTKSRLQIRLPPQPSHISSIIFPHLLVTLIFSDRRSGFGPAESPGEGHCEKAIGGDIPGASGIRFAPLAMADSGTTLIRDN
jgi:hypothetical protein